MRYCLGWLYLRCFGWKLLGERPPFKKYLILAAPHTSNWDVPVMLAMSYVYGIRVSWIGKHSLFRGPLGPLMRFLGGVPVDRRARHNAVQQMADEFHRRDELCLMITPEGTRDRAEHWKSGFYYIARSAGVPIVLGLIDFKTQSRRAVRSRLSDRRYYGRHGQDPGLLQRRLWKVPREFRPNLPARRSGRRGELSRPCQGCRDRPATRHAAKSARPNARSLTAQRFNFRLMAWRDDRRGRGSTAEQGRGVAPQSTQSPICFKPLSISNTNA